MFTRLLRSQYSAMLGSHRAGDMPVMVPTMVLGVDNMDGNCQLNLIYLSKIIGITAFHITGHKQFLEQ